MDAKERGTALVREDGHGNACRNGARQGVRVAEEPSEEALARGADEHRAPEGDELVESGEELEVVLHGLAEADPRVEADPFLGDPRGHREGEPLLEEGAHVGDDVVVLRVVLHRPRLAEHVHEAEVVAAVGDNARELRIGPERGDVVDHHGAERERPAGDLRLRRVDRQGSALEALEHGQDPPQLLVDRDALGAGAGRLAPDVDEGGSLGQQPAGLRDGDVGREEAPAVRERVGRDVHDPEHGRPRKGLLERGSHGASVSYGAPPPMIDLHSHILPGLDDGARTIEEARALARLAASEGITAIAATPHVRTDYPTRPEVMEERVGELRRDFAERAIPVEVLHGGEIDLDMLTTLDDGELRRFTLAQSGRYLLLEFPYSGWPAGLEETVHGLGLRGFVALMAHPERNADVQAAPERLADLVRAGVLVQITAASLDGRLGRSSREAALQLLALRLAHVLASDAHTPDVRAAGLAAAAGALGDSGLARYLTEEAPAAIVAGEAVPEPPALPRRKRFIVF